MKDDLMRPRRMLQRAACAMLVLGSVQAQASEAPEGVSHYAWERIEARAARVARVIGLGACGEAKLKQLLFEAACGMGDGQDDAIEDPGPGRARLSREEQKACEGGGGPGAAAAVAAFVAANRGWVLDRQWGDLIWAGRLASVVPPTYVPPLPTRTPAPTGHEAL